MQAKKISRGFRAWFGVKNIKRVVGTDFNKMREDWKIFFKRRDKNKKLGEVLAHVLGVKKKSSRKLGQEGLQRQRQKTDTLKIVASRPHCYRSDAPPAETLLFFGFAYVLK